jgi:hypothetical protein
MTPRRKQTAAPVDSAMSKAQRAAASLRQELLPATASHFPLKARVIDQEFERKKSAGSRAF